MSFGTKSSANGTDQRNKSTTSEMDDVGIVAARRTKINSLRGDARKVPKPPLGAYERKSTVFVTPAKAAELEFGSVLPRDVLVAKVGNPPGIAAVYPDREPPAIVTQDVIRLCPNLELALPVYLEGFLNSAMGQWDVRNITIQATRQRFSLGQFKEIGN